ncbi:porin [Flavobacterium ardleyense]|uniref:Porin n=1 Tax=Flavobacterium ardleyense TaxID=2038737 RepID=A0ABW5ZBH1_9FLAO
MKKIITFLVFTICFGAVAQDIKINTKDNDLKLAAIPYYNYGKGLGITSPDSLFQFNIRFRMQNRVTFMQNEGEDASYAGEVKRMRLRFDGFVGNPHFLYVVQLSFAAGDVGEVKEGENVNIIRDAAIFYRPNKNWSFVFGQTKLPGNRQRINSSGALQLTDRSINNAKFTIDRDFGFQAYYLNENQDRFSYNVKSAISNGEGRNWTKSADDGVALTGKLELMPFGSFKKDGTNFEGDIAREETPKLLVSGAFSQNNLSKRTQGQLGNDLFAPKTTKAVFLDAMLKYNGWSLMSSYMSRATKDPIAINPDDITEFNYVPVGSGMDYQMSYAFPTHYEIIGRFSTQNMHNDIKAFTPDSKQYSIGVTKYLWEHAFKLQGEVTLSDLNYFDGSNKQNWYVRFQVEIGI